MNEETEMNRQIAVVVLLLLAIAPLANAQSFATKQITDGNAETSIHSPRIYGDKIYWTTREPYAINMYDASSSQTTQIVSNKNQAYGGFEVDANRLVYVLGNSLRTVHFFDLSNSVDAVLSNPSKSAYWPDISDSLIIWSEYEDVNIRGQANGTKDIYSYDLGADGIIGTSDDTGRTLVLDTDNTGGLSISADKIVYVSDDNDTKIRNLYLYDISTQQTEQIVPSTTKQTEPHFSNNKVVWRDFRSGTADIWAYDLNTKTETQITSTPLYESQVRLYGDYIVFVRNDDSAEIRHKIVLYDLSSSAEYTFDSPGEQYSPDIFGDKVVWYDVAQPDSKSNIFMATICQSGYKGCQDICIPETECCDAQDCPSDQDCFSGVCLECIDDSNCDDFNSCTTDSCVTTECKNLPIVCQAGQSCSNGVCVGTPQQQQTVTSTYTPPLAPERDPNKDRVIDGISITRIDDSKFSYYNQMVVSGNIIAWVGCTDKSVSHPSKCDYLVYIYDIQTGETTNIASSGFLPAIADAKVFYLKGSSIFFYDTKTKNTGRLTCDNTGMIDFDADGNIVAYGNNFGTKWIEVSKIKKSCDDPDSDIYKYSHSLPGILSRNSNWVVTPTGAQEYELLIAKKIRVFGTNILAYTETGYRLYDAIGDEFIDFSVPSNNFHDIQGDNIYFTADGALKSFNINDKSTTSLKGDVGGLGTLVADNLLVTHQNGHTVITNLYIGDEKSVNIGLPRDFDGQTIVDKTYAATISFKEISKAPS